MRSTSRWCTRAFPTCGRCPGGPGEPRTPVQPCRMPTSGDRAQPCPVSQWPGDRLLTTTTIDASHAGGTTTASPWARCIRWMARTTGRCERSLLAGPPEDDACVDASGRRARQTLCRPRARDRTGGDFVTEVAVITPGTPHPSLMPTTDTEWSRRSRRCRRRRLPVIRFGQSRRGRLRRAVSIRHHARTQQAPRFRSRCPLLPRRCAGAHRDQQPVRGTLTALALRRACRRAAVHGDDVRRRTQTPADPIHAELA